MDDEHQLNQLTSRANFLAVQEEASGDGQGWQPRPRDGPRWRSRVSDDQVGTAAFSPANSISLQADATPGVTSPGTWPSLQGGVSSPGGPGPSERGVPSPAQPGPQPQLSGPPAPHSPVAEELWTDRGFPGFTPVEETTHIDAGTDVTNAGNGVTADNVIDNSSENSPQITEQDDFISVNRSKLLDENRKLKDEMNCVVCLDRRRDNVILPCGHVIVCSLCVSGLQRKCPTCRGHIEETVRIYLSPFKDSDGRRANATSVIETLTT